MNKNGPTVRPELGPCWVWTGKTRATYGAMSVGNTTVGTHRLSWEIHNGPILDGLCVLHRCDNPPCVRPEHLFLGTQQDNATDRYAKGRVFTIKRPNKATLTPDAIRKMRAMRAEGAKIKEISAAFDRSEGHVSDVLGGRCWKHVK